MESDTQNIFYKLLYTYKIEERQCSRFQNLSTSHPFRNHTCVVFCPSHLGPTLVVDGMACLNNWYSCEDWLCGGQWKEYMNVLKRWVEAFTVAGIRLVFFFDGVVNEQKRQVWVRTETAKVIQGFSPAASKNCIECCHIIHLNL